ncbi:U-box domain-containing protein 26 [Selaginella moellendorffii]|nr:U-box domain-containing protein 26 [Selaginella moellendorffii]|eukprot:XP_002988236.2 U-box domain-containing protein 26 [Selaginella moellendorffii]
MAISPVLDIQLPRVPTLFRCPISLELMKDPVTLSTGLTYDRSSIEKWFDDGHHTCPGTMQLVKVRDLVPNHTLRRLIQEWCVANKSRGIERIPTPKQPLDDEQAGHLVRQISSAELSGRAKSRLLRNLRASCKESDKNRKCIAGAGAIPALSGLVSSFQPRISFDRPSNLEDLQCCEDAVAVLVILLPLEIESLRKSIINPSLLAVLSWILHRRNTEGQINAARLLELVATDDESKSMMGATERLIPGLVKLVKEDSAYPRAVRASLTALLAIVSCRKNLVKAVQGGVVPPLIELLSEASRLNTERALAVLEFVARCAEGREALMDHSLSVPMLVKIILTVSDLASERAVGILLLMCQADDSVVQAAASEGAFTQMILLIQADNTSETNHRARQFLKLLRGAVPRECMHDFAFTMPF